ncbi:MAG: hypothetical protein OXI91_16775 [Chloroflexota bacterium]|nr:hypothetical protein [Chloroflexota bacterium]
MSLNLATVAKEFSLSEADLTRESIRAFLAEQLRLLDADRRARCAKYGVGTLEEMDALIRRGEVEEDDILEDFQEVDYLYDRIERVRTMLEES